VYGVVICECAAAHEVAPAGLEVEHDEAGRHSNDEFAIDGNKLSFRKHLPMRRELVVRPRH
jgi:hypothetical protein